MLEELHAAARAVARRQAGRVDRERSAETTEIAGAIAAKSAYSSEAWKPRHAAELRLRAARAVVDALAAELERAP